MANFEIEREVVIDAPADVVWRTITEPDQISRWFADRVELVAEPGGQGAMYFGDEGEGGPLVVEVVEPPCRFSFRWNHPAGEEPVAGNSLLVEFTLAAEGGSGLDCGWWRAASTCSPGRTPRRSATPGSTTAAGSPSWGGWPGC
jgi:uncharacterized protein YndB with AHSA1/START domain